MTEFTAQWVAYFDESVEFRTDSDKAMQHFGMYPIEYSVPAQDVGGVSEPEYLANLEKFAEYLRAQPEVAHVYTLSDIMKRLKKLLDDHTRELSMNKRPPGQANSYAPVNS